MILPGACGLWVQLYNDDRNSEEGCKLVRDRPPENWLRLQCLYKVSIRTTLERNVQYR